jgi:DNA-binding CsgD family transcriptional regulator
MPIFQNGSGSLAAVRLEDPSADSSVLENAVLSFAREYQLSRRETETVLVALQGLARKEIAAQLGVGYRTVSEYWLRICRKSSCQDRNQVVARFIEHLLRELS